MKRIASRSIVALLAAAMAATSMSVAWSQEGGDKDQWTAPARASRKKNPIPADEKSIAAGKVSYTAQCFTCHGEKGKGDGPAAKDLEKAPGDLSSPKLWQQTDGALFWKITEGKKPMPTFAKLLTEDERWNVVNYVRTLAPKP